MIMSKGNDDSVLRALVGATFGPKASLTLPSGKVLDAATANGIVKGLAPDVAPTGIARVANSELDAILWGLPHYSPTRAQYWAERRRRDHAHSQGYDAANILVEMLGGKLVGLLPTLVENARETMAVCAEANEWRQYERAHGWHEFLSEHLQDRSDV